MNVSFFVYILASKRNGTLYVGVTNNLARRVAEHKAKLVRGSPENTTWTNSFISRLSILSWKLAHESTP
jgi:predicted GIY-YIG superfamily endonuclease